MLEFCEHWCFLGHTHCCLSLSHQIRLKRMLRYSREVLVCGRWKMCVGVHKLWRAAQTITRSAPVALSCLCFDLRLFIVTFFLQTVARSFNCYYAHHWSKLFQTFLLKLLSIYSSIQIENYLMFMTFWMWVSWAFAVFTFEGFLCVLFLCDKTHDLISGMK